MTMIMVSYRRADAQDMAGRIADYLIAKFGENSVFFDVNSIPTGVNYHDRIEKAIVGSNVMVAVIGQHWIAIELFSNFVDELHPRQLQKANRLLQLRRHDQLLTEL